jgi:hypothetical protein
MNQKFTQIHDNVAQYGEDKEVFGPPWKWFVWIILRCGWAKIKCSYVTQLSHISDCFYGCSLPRMALCCFPTYHILLILYCVTLTPFHVWRIRWIVFTSVLQQASMCLCRKSCIMAYRSLIQDISSVLERFKIPSNNNSIRYNIVHIKGYIKKFPD